MISPTGDNLVARLFTEGIAAKQPHLLPTPTDPENWRHPDIGWGLVLPENTTLSDAEKARGEDAPEPLQQLLSHRNDAPVLRYNPESGLRYLRRYYVDRGPQDIDLSAANFGVGVGKIPQYLLIYGTPEDIPWNVQYNLNSLYYAGRLDLTGDQLSNYVHALINDWEGSVVNPLASVIWAVDHGANDITRKMRNAIASRLHKKFQEDADIKDKTIFIDGRHKDATTEKLIDAVASGNPGLIITTSHGQTGPLTDPIEMAASLGHFVDANKDKLQPGSLLSDWQPDGAIWYAHACCGAGSDGTEQYNGLVQTDGAVDRVLKAVAALGSQVAPMPRALLGASKPLRAFVGHVDPTFDWTIQNNETRQILTKVLVQSFYKRLYFGQPIGMALEPCRRSSSALLNTYDLAKQAYNNGADTEGDALACRLMALDWRSLVLLGDPTVTLSIPKK